MGRFGRLALVLVAIGGLSGCARFTGELMNESFWAGNPFTKTSNAELGIAALAKGNYVTAESHFLKALKTDPRNVDALLGAGILYQNTNQTTKARQMYEAVIALHPDDSFQFVVWTDIKTRPASEIASVNLAMMESGGVTQTMSGVGAPGQGAGGMTVKASSGMPINQSNGISATSSPMPLLGRQSNQNGFAPAEAEMVGQFSNTDASIISRFSTIRALRDQGLITDDEYQTRRRANVGGLLPLTSPPPAEGLDRPVPSSEQISGRLRAIGRALELRAITISQHASERTMILDALMPAAPVVVARPALPPKGLMQAADSVRRLEKLRDSGYISSDEYARERRAIELSMQPVQPGASMAPQAAPVKGVEMVEAEKPKPSGPQPGIHLASYRDEKQAERGWAQIKRAQRTVLADLDHFVVKVTLGRKGIYYRLKAGPVASQDEAKKLCSTLKRQRQFCEPTVIEQN